MKENTFTNDRTKTISPGTSAFLALVPFLGAIYNGTYLRALYQFTMFVILVVFCDAADIEWLGVIGGIVFYIYTIVDAYRTAKHIKMGEQIREYPLPKFGQNTLKIQAIILIAIGALLLLDNFGIGIVRLIGILWPVVLIAAGAYLLWLNKKRDADGGSGSETSSPVASAGMTVRQGSIRISSDEQPRGGVRVETIPPPPATPAADGVAAEETPEPGEWTTAGSTGDRPADTGVETNETEENQAEEKK
ncbi:MAG: hypothetical protein JXQ27_17010 [Acidobacteria bacterium]|nr:hypothetical protein [Acidobacteriota bacterium]